MCYEFLVIVFLLFCNNSLIFLALDLPAKESADEASDLEEIVAPPVGVVRRKSSSEHSSAGRVDSTKQPPTPLSPLTTDSTDISRLRQNITELERRLKSR